MRVPPSTDLLDGNAPEDTIDQPSVIIGRGKMGTALASMGMGEDLVLGRGEEIPLTLPYSSGKGDNGEDGEFACACVPMCLCFSAPCLISAFSALFRSVASSSVS